MEGGTRQAEETGYEVTSIKFLTIIICTPGYCEELSAWLCWKIAR